MSKRSTFTPHVTTIPSFWLNSLQEWLSTYASANFTVAQNGATGVRVAAGAGNDQVGVGISGTWRYNTANADATHPGGGAGTYDIYVTGSNDNIAGAVDSTVYAFGVAIRAAASPPPTAIYRKVGTLAWNGTAITSVSPLIGVSDWTVVISNAVAAEAALRSAADSAEVTNRNSAISSAVAVEAANRAADVNAEEAARIADVDTEESARIGVDSSLSALITALTNRVTPKYVEIRTSADFTVPDATETSLAAGGMTEIFDNAGIHSAGTNRLVIPASGVYRIFGHVLFYSGAALGTGSFYVLLRDGSGTQIWGWAMHANPDAIPQNIQIDYTAYFAAGQIIDVFCNQTSGADVVIAAGSYVGAVSHFLGAP